MSQAIRIGTRGSQLALWQAYHIEQLLQAGGLQTEIVTIVTKGDQVLHKGLAEIGSKGLFTEELEAQLLSGDIDIAVHSAKDMPSKLPAGLELIAFTEREEMHDVLVSLDPTFSLDNPPAGKNIVGTSSTRRKALMKRHYPHITLTEARGNLQTRFRKMEEGQYHAMLLAYAGVHRMGYDDKIVYHFPLDTFVPAVGQGSIAIEASEKLEPAKKEKIRKLTNHPETEYCLLAERAFLHSLEGGCSVPVFGLARLNSQGIHLVGGVIGLDGKELITAEKIGEPLTAYSLGQLLAEELKSKGAEKILKEIRS